MSARASALAALAKRDLEACVDAPSVFTLFRKLRYPVEDTPVHVPLDEGDLPGGLRDGIAARYPVALVGGVRSGEPLVSVTLFELRDHTRKSELIRSIAQAWTRRFLGEHLLVFAVKDQPDQGVVLQKLLKVGKRHQLLPLVQLRPPHQTGWQETLPDPGCPLFRCRTSAFSLLSS